MTMGLFAMFFSILTATSKSPSRHFGQGGIADLQRKILDAASFALEDFYGGEYTLSHSNLRLLVRVNSK